MQVVPEGDHLIVGHVSAAVRCRPALYACRLCAALQPHMPLHSHRAQLSLECAAADMPAVLERLRAAKVPFRKNVRC